jgi:hypothetical protein
VAASTARHETRALLRAHLSAATGYRHRTEHCPVCRKLLRLVMEPEGEDGADEEEEPGAAPGAAPDTASASRPSPASGPAPAPGPEPAPRCPPRDEGPPIT